MNTNKKVCGCCQTAKAPAQFHKSPLSSGQFLPICKLCCKDKLKTYTEITGSESAAFWLVLSELGVPFIKEVWDEFQTFKATATPSTDLIMAYLRTLSESGIKVDGFWQSDVMLDMLMDSMVDRDAGRKELDLTEQQKIWGKFMSDGKLDIEAYQFLNETFEDYTKELYDIDANLEKRYRDLAKAELRKRQADEAGDIQEIAKAQDNLKKILDMLKLSDFQNSKQSAVEKHIERLAWTIENVKPAECEDLNKYKDFSNFGDTWKDIMRCVQNLVCGTREYPEVPKGER